ncbi:IclR family transcriptional regulator (plasmid) [Halarchaeum sp. CBA1220]|uniref:IclR family transcriptional regulator n=1 Tax=Halarchaeum sp. CBA1220 TaxID=1853682 RepID=UPI000F3A993A|nr:IclR family transcriptional regulator [Halarchaeum sp. CBA1220]QLC35388.1 IclR family transcriptional regulator [Halarchaeum sp. CBA1220]
MQPDARNPVKSLLTMDDVVGALDELDGARVTEVAAHIERPQSVVHNHLNTLRQLGYVVKPDEEYALSLRFFELGERARHRHALYEAARPEVEKLAADTGELITLLVEEHGLGVYLDVRQGDSDIRYPAMPGNRIHLHCSAVGKAILAHLSEGAVDEILERHGLPAQTAETITERDALRRELETVRERGLAFDKQEFRDGLESVGAPITGQDGDVLGALSVAGPARRMHDERLENDLPERLRRAINVIELNLTEPNINVS